jgi:hypothetical protein
MPEFYPFPVRVLASLYLLYKLYARGKSYRRSQWAKGMDDGKISPVFSDDSWVRDLPTDFDPAADRHFSRR